MASNNLHKPLSTLIIIFLSTVAESQYCPYPCIPPPIGPGNNPPATLTPPVSTTPPAAFQPPPFTTPPAGYVPFTPPSPYSFGAAPPPPEPIVTWFPFYYRRPPRVFRPDPHFLKNEKRYKELKKQILGEESEDVTMTDLVNLRKTINLAITSSVDYEEAEQKLLRIKLDPGQEKELCNMLLECCSQARTYIRQYGLLGQWLCMTNKIHQENFEKCFLETDQIGNVVKFFAHLLATDALPWHLLSYLQLTEEDINSPSRTFVKTLFKELSEHLGTRLLNEHLSDPAMQDSSSLFLP